MSDKQSTTISGSRQVAVGREYLMSTGLKEVFGRVVDWLVKSESKKAKPT